MPWWGWLVVAAAVLVVLTAAWLSWTAGRLDRMHLRCESAMASLVAQLHRRAAVAGELAGGGLADPASALLLLEAARTAREAGERGGSDHWQAQSDLTAALYAVELGSPDDPLVLELADAARRAALARRIHNDLASRAGQLRSRRRVRWFGLAGHAAPPQSVDFDDRSGFAPDPAPPPRWRRLVRIEA